jgi:RNA polymerase sigma-B factor
MTSTPSGHNRDPRDRLVERYLPLARKLARRYHRYRREPLDDLMQVASLGLVKAARRYEEGRGVSFAAYATAIIEGELKHHLRDHTSAVHLPRSAKERALRLNRAMLACEQDGIAPTIQQLAERLGITEQEVHDARQALQALETRSLDGPIGEDHSEPRPIAETVGCCDHRFELAEMRCTLAAAWRMLRLSDRRILHLRFFEDSTQAEIAAKIGMSQVHVSRTMKGALAQLQVAITGETNA